MGCPSIHAAWTAEMQSYRSCYKHLLRHPDDEYAQARLVRCRAECNRLTTQGMDVISGRLQAKVRDVQGLEAQQSKRLKTAEAALEQAQRQSETPRRLVLFWAAMHVLRSKSRGR